MPPNGRFGGRELPGSNAPRCGHSTPMCDFPKPDMALETAANGGSVR
jgi:hypothetical protein